MGGCKPAESHVEEREERKEKRTGGSLAAGCYGCVRLCLWPRMPLAAHSQPAAGAEQAQSRAPSRSRRLRYCPCSERRRRVTRAGSGQGAWRQDKTTQGASTNTNFYRWQRSAAMGFRRMHGLFSFKNFQDSSSHRIFGHIYEILNII